jgi:hypothetical protein
MVLRLALVYALLDARSTIEVEHLDAALAMWAYAKGSAEHIFNGRQTNPVAQKILNTLEQGPISMTEAHKVLSNHANKRQIECALQELVATRKITVVEEKTKGRPKKIILLCEKSEISEKSIFASDSAKLQGGLSSHVCEKSEISPLVAGHPQEPDLFSLISQSREKSHPSEPTDNTGSGLISLFSLNSQGSGKKTLMTCRGCKFRNGFFCNHKVGEEIVSWNGRVGQDLDLEHECKHFKQALDPQKTFMEWEEGEI